MLSHRFSLVPCLACNNNEHHFYTHVVCDIRVIINQIPGEFNYQTCQCLCVTNRFVCHLILIFTQVHCCRHTHTSEVSFDKMCIFIYLLFLWIHYRGRCLLFLWIVRVSDKNRLCICVKFLICMLVHFSVIMMIGCHNNNNIERVCR